MAPPTSKRPRRKTPARIAVIDADNCTGCEACIEICPVDCIELRTTGRGVCGVEVWCEVDAARCVGCELCLRLPRRPGESYQLLVCPWEAIEMVPSVAVDVAASVCQPGRFTGS